MEKFFASFGEGDVVGADKFPKFDDLGTLSDNIIKQEKQIEISNSLDDVLDAYKKFLKDILVNEQ